MKKLKMTLNEVNKILKKHKINYLLTRYLDNNFDPDDLDIFVKRKDFGKTIRVLKASGYTSSSHDHALGGRIKGAQINLINIGRIKIDLHNDFTWRKQKYLDTNLLWSAKRRVMIENAKVDVPDPLLDTYLVVVNIIFEKTYLLNEFRLIKKFLNKLEKDERVKDQSAKYNYSETLQMFFKWFAGVSEDNKPIFLPLRIILHSYWEKFRVDKFIDLVSLCYFIFFRTRYLINRKLPYN